MLDPNTKYAGHCLAHKGEHDLSTQIYHCVLCGQELMVKESRYQGEKDADLAS